MATRRRSWLMLATLAAVGVAAAVGVVAWDGGRVRARPAPEPAPAWSATLHTPPDPVVSPVQRASGAVQVGPLPTSAVQLQQAGGTLYIRDSGRVRAVDPRSGRERWAYPAGPQGPANPEVVSFVAGVEATAVAARRTDGSGPEAWSSCWTRPPAARAGSAGSGARSTPTAWPLARPGSISWPRTT